MSRRIEEVFPGIKLNDGLQQVLKHAVVTRVTMNRSRSLLRVYLECSACLPKEKIYELERALTRSLQAGSDLQVRVIERFRLSRLYTAKTLLEQYGESIELELRQYNHMLAWLFHTAVFAFPAKDQMSVTIADTVVSRDLEEEFYRILDKILNERCGLGVQLEITRQVRPETQAIQENELLMRAAARNIVAQTSLASRQRTDGSDAQATGEMADADSTSGTAADGKAQAQGGLSGVQQNTSSGSAAVQPADAAASCSVQSERAGGRGREDGSKWRSGRGKGSRGLHLGEPGAEVMYGRDFDDDSIPLSEVDELSGTVVIYGEIIDIEMRTLRSERVLLILTVTDDTDTIRVKIFLDGEEQDAAGAMFKKGTFVRIKGRAQEDSFDHELTIMSVSGIRRSVSFRKVRQDNSPVKRVELHCHSKMSDMDGVTDAAALVKRAWKWGHSAIALTDHGGVQAFPEANHAMEDIDRAYRAEWQKEHPEATKDELKKISAPFKVIYGMEAYLIDDLKGIAVNSRGQDLQDAYVVFDIETTGLSNQTCKIIEIGAVRVEGGKITDRFSTFVNPGVPIPMRIEELTSISDNMVLDAPPIEQVLPEFLEFCSGAVMVAHNADFDMGFIIKACEEQGFPDHFTYVDTVAMARVLLPGLGSFKLDKVAKAVGVLLDHHHRAVDDAACTAEILVKFIQMLADRGVTDLDGLNEMASVSDEAKRKMPSHHVILLATCETGRQNLYRLVSASHLHYVYKMQARLPKSLVQKYREGILVGSACVKGELYDAMLRGAQEEEIIRLIDFYDYLEIQPVGNNAFLIESDRNEAITSVEDLQEMNRRIVSYGEQSGKPVVATCDVHFMDPEDAIYRTIIMAGKKFKDAEDQAPLYLHTTEEMLEEFAYLGSEKAREVVIENPNRIADQVEKISPIRAGKFPPVIEDSDKTLREICYRRAYEIYGDPLPELVEARLERELNSIISNGYAVMYIIAQKLVWKSNEDGYLVGSRGSVGSSFAATMSGITEVNPLPPHYLCDACKYVDFDSEEVTKYKNLGMAGCDMPDAVCPKCGKPLTKMGFNIPFETFLGFKGNKEPDIDLNFSGEYQSKAHKYTEVIFGAGQTFRAGTIGTLADKTAFGYVKNYYADKGITKRTCDIDRIVKGCVGIRRTTGQHPGGIIVLPMGEDINAFTPVQHPADDMTTDIVTTHFDYHSIDENLLKLDILGHDDPTMIRMLEDLTGTDATKVPLDEPKVMSLFKSTEALGITPDDIGGCPLGCLGVPEFGTDFVIQMLLDTKPQRFSDLIRISGLSHGTDVWLGNAQTLIEENKATISTAICTRDDIMTYLIAKGLESEESFTIMEAVRKGKGLKPQWEEEMRAHDVPDWYIWSCNKIKYMFPKAHAVAYVMMAYRIAWYKIYYPLAYYAAYFSIRASAFSLEKMCLGKERLEEHMRAYESHKDTATNQEAEQYKDMKIVQEMYARGFDFVPLDLYQAQAHRFRIVGEKSLMPSLDSLEGLGDKAADSVVLAARDGKFLSKDDFRKRAKVGRTVSDTLDRIGVLSDLP
ncbi:MAG: PolC-type DNA polymerase III, partial [Eubacterium sp.]|nr:PolC-type DNA polymerase III [Eubacterium sp.]